MFYAIGETLFRIGVAVTVAYFVVYTLAVASGIPVHTELSNSHALMSTLRGNIGPLLEVLGISTGAYIGVYVITGLVRLITGRQIDIEFGKYRGLFVFIGLYTVAFSGIMALTSLFTMYIGWAIPPLAGTARALTAIAQTITAITLSYYVAVKVFGIPTF